MKKTKSLLTLCLLAASGTAQQKAFVVTEATAMQFAQAELAWATAHRASPNELVGLKVDVPSLDYYMPDGHSIWYGTDPGKNATFADSLPGPVRAAPQAAVRPTLAEAIAMFPELKVRENELLHTGGPVLLAITYLNWDRCKPQNDAVRRLAKRSGAHGFEVIEIDLHQ